jgi:hypothetical protein
MAAERARGTETIAKSEIPISDRAAGQLLTCVVSDPASNDSVQQARYSHHIREKTTLVPSQIKQQA